MTGEELRERIARDIDVWQHGPMGPSESPGPKHRIMARVAAAAIVEALGITREDVNKCLAGHRAPVRKLALGWSRVLDAAGTP